MKNQLAEALYLLTPTAEYNAVLLEDGAYTLEWLDVKQAEPARKTIDDKIAELRAAEPMRILRVERTRRLEETDWWALPDLVMSNDRQIYRQKLRDLPATANPALDESGELSGVTWPEIPD